MSDKTLKNVATGVPLRQPAEPRSTRRITDESAACLPEQFRCLVRKKYPLPPDQMVRLGKHLETIADPATSIEARRRHVKEIYDNGLFLALAGNFDEFCEKVIEWRPEEVQDFKRWLGTIPPKTSPPTANTAQVVEISDAEPSNSTAQVNPTSAPPQTAGKAEPPGRPESRDGAGRAIQPKIDPSKRTSKLRVVKRSKKPAPATNSPATDNSGSEGDELPSANHPTDNVPSQGPLDPTAPTVGPSSCPESAIQDTPASSLPIPINEAQAEDVCHIPLAMLHRPEELRVRARTDKKTVGDYAQLMKDGVDLGPLSLFEVGDQLVIADGNHRFEAALAAERETIACTVYQGTLKDALQFALAANAKRGLRLTNADKRRCVEIAITKFDDWSDRRIADLAGVSYVFVGKVRKQLVTVTSSSGKVGKDGKRRKPKVKPEVNQNQNVEATPSDNEPQGGEDHTEEEQPAGDPDAGEDSSSDVGTAEHVGEQEEDAPPFDRKAEWLHLRQHLLNTLDHWPEDHRAYLGDKLCEFAEKHCPKD